MRVLHSFGKASVFGGNRANASTTADLVTEFPQVFRLLKTSKDF